MKASALALLGLSTAVSAWLPSERNFFGEQPNSVAHNLAAGKGRAVKRYLPAFNKIRGVNLGSLFIIEPWMASQEWAAMGCEGTNSEFDCMARLGQEAGNKAFATHWETWITEEDLDKMKEYGINTIRVPVGYWLVEDTVYRDSEHFPQGGMAYLDKLVGHAADRGMYVILDLHGAPGAQEANQPFTGQYASTPGFYQTYQYDRAYWFLQVMTDRIHQNLSYRTVGTLEVLNEPARTYPTLISEYYATALSKIRESERNLKIPPSSALTVQFMDSAWGAGNARDIVNGDPSVAYDDHRYLKWAPVDASKDAYIDTSCGDTFGADGNSPVVVGEWSLAVKDDVESSPEWDPTVQANHAFYTRWWAAQVQAYERDVGWVFWSWKTQLGGDWRWSYRQAVEAGVVPSDPASAAALAKCS